MAEAFSLAAGILQVVDFGAAYLTTARNLYKSGKDGAENLSDLQAFASNLEKVLDTLRKHSQNADGVAGSPNDSALAKECAATLEDMLDKLRRIKLSSKGRRRDAAIDAFTMLWNKERIDALQGRLDHYVQQLTLNLMVSLRTHATTSLQNQQQILDNLATLMGKGNPTTDVTSHGFGSAVIEYVTKPLQESTRDAGKLFLRQELVKAVYEGGRDKETSSNIHMSESHRARLYNVFLANLSYPGNQDRELQIPKAHQETFRWVFEDPKNDTPPWSSFKTWLESDDQLYWITGKAGAGKSTLMKFITQPAELPEAEPLEAELSGKFAPNEARCAKYLRNRAHEKPFILASFYFWATGSAVQKSTKGLFLTFLAQVLRSYPDIIPLLSPAAWEALSLFNEPPRFSSPEEVGAMFHRAVVHVDSLATPVLFIDGLDEFDGNHEGLISLLHSLVSKTSVKLCVSSRPWVEFEKAFEHKPSLRLEDLTRSDIRKYISSKFLSDTSFKDLQQRETSFAIALMEEVAEKASGVFLWVRLVVSSILSGIRFGDRIIDLKTRFDLLPPDLERLYERMLDSLDPFYRQHAAEYFAIMRACPEPPRALLLSFADEENPIEFALALEHTTMPPRQITDRVKAMGLRVNSRCKGLLEIDRSSHQPDGPTPNASEIRVHYLHKTVQDYIDSKGTQRKLEPVSDDIHIKLLAAGLSVFKAVHRGNHESKPVETVHESIIEEYMYHAAGAHSEHAVDVIHLMDGFREAVVSKRGEIPFPKEVRDSLGDYFRMEPPSRLLCQAAACSVYQYVRVKANKNGLITDESNTCSRAVLKGTFAGFVPVRHSHPGGQYPLLLLPLESSKPLDHFTVKTVEAILQKGCNPNHTVTVHYNSTRRKFPSAWTVVIAEIVRALAHKSPTSRNREILGEIAELMISHGAVINQATVGNAMKMLQEVFIFRMSMLSKDSIHLDDTEDRAAIQKEIYLVLKRLKAGQGHLALNVEQRYQLETRSQTLVPRGISGGMLGTGTL
ncbi:hypothetical protein B0T10DRAFT_96367 [Thelonectria olida]|uniref:NACHT domain-containing protein n=1 Tax=Thelonectria olida TaxID=1576542 RepID=A0A9P8VNE5_9HYPO|nr:hypothetical protein B0T10DRAFT_96367 [Thelonectria olida]